MDINHFRTKHTVLTSIAIKHIFFDLDRTLWDFEQNSRNTLAELYEEYKLQELGYTGFEQFFDIYRSKNEICWALYRENRLSKESMRSKRFKMSLQEVGHTGNTLAATLGKEYVLRSPRQTLLMEGSTEVLEYLAPRYNLHIITNGFEEVQHIKMKACKIDHYFGQVITSERAGSKKPHPGIFEFAFRLTKARPVESVMIGDDHDIDVAGAQRAGMTGIHYAPGRETPGNGNTIRHLRELMELF